MTVGTWITIAAIVFTVFCIGFFWYLVTEADKVLDLYRAPVIKPKRKYVRKVKPEAPYKIEDK